MASTVGSGAAAILTTYDEYGRPGDGASYQMRYTGQYTPGPDMGLYYYKNRFYHAGLGRFLQTYGDGMNLYGYVGGDPVNRVDPSGLGWIQMRRLTCPAIADPDNQYGIIADCSWIYYDAWVDTDGGPRGPHREGGGGGGGVRSPPPRDPLPPEDELLQCLADTGSGALDGFMDPENQAMSVAGSALQAVSGTAVEARNSARGRPSGTFGRNATIVPGSNVRLTGRQLLARGAKRFIPGYAFASAGVALVTGGIAAYNSEACQGLFD